jgi:ATP-dependent Clp protease ATP-binding subunit ClpC
MSILDRFSSHLKDVLAKSSQLATQLKNMNVEPIHIFFVIQNQKGSVAAEILNRLKIDLKFVERLIVDMPIEKEFLKPSVATAEIAPMSAQCKSAIEKALIVAQERGHNYIGTEHLLFGLVELNDTRIMSALKNGKITKEEILKQLDTVLNNASQFPHITEMMDVVDKIQEGLDAIEQSPAIQPTRPAQNTKRARKKETALDFFATNLTNPELQKQIDPVIGRENEIERIIQILCRRTKNNPVLLGDPGVGKTAIVEGLAKKITEGKVPDILINKKIYSLDMGMLIAGTIYRGEFEARLRQVIDDVAQNPNIILFIDELHNIVGAGSNQGTMDAANILKPALARGQIRCIGSTTTAEFKKHIENDAALERRFQPIFVKEPSIDDSIKILDGIKSNYEAFHNIKIDKTATEAAVRLSDRYINNKFLPDKAIDLLDETSAAKRIAQKGANWTGKIERLKQKLEKITITKENAAMEDKFDDAVKLKAEEEKLKKEIDNATKKANVKKRKYISEITEKDILSQVAKITGIKPSELAIENGDKTEEIKKKIQERIVGQDDVVEDVSMTITKSSLGLNRQDRPLASFLFVGPSGVGKTELAKILSKTLFPKNPDALVKLDMSEFNESFGVSKLLGSPAGYIGYKESNNFTDKIKNNPHCVVLFDDIDKAHKDVTKLLLQILENGEITDSTGKKISLKHAIIILTTNYGAEENKKTGFGFGAESEKYKDAKKRTTEKIKEYFSAELINRIDSVCLFNALKPFDLARIAEIEIQDLNKQLEKYKTRIESNEKIIANFISKMPKDNQSARDIRREIRNEIEKIISSVILKNKTKKSYTLEMDEDRIAIK